MGGQCETACCGLLHIGRTLAVTLMTRERRAALDGEAHQVQQAADANSLELLKRLQESKLRDASSSFQDGRKLQGRTAAPSSKGLAYKHPKHQCHPDHDAYTQALRLP
jgi:hypothetical protein